MPVVSRVLHRGLKRSAATPGFSASGLTLCDPTSRMVPRYEQLARLSALARSITQYRCRAFPGRCAMKEAFEVHETASCSSVLPARRTVWVKTLCGRPSAEDPLRKILCGRRKRPARILSAASGSDSRPANCCAIQDGILAKMECWAIFGRRGAEGGP